jgi:hypothetical protein
MKRIKCTYARRATPWTPRSRTRAIVDHVDVTTIGLIDRLVAIAVTKTIAAAPLRLLAGRVGDGFLAVGPTRDPVSEGGVDGAGAQHVIQDHCGATDYAGLVAMGRRQDL